MGVLTVISFPAYVRASDVGKAVGIALGCPARIGRWLEVDGVQVVANEAVPECCNIIVELPSGDVRSFLYHFEFCEDGSRGMMLRSSDESIRLAQALVRTFGGTVDYYDCDEVQVDFQVVRGISRTPEDGEEYDRWQEHILRTEVIA